MSEKTIAYESKVNGLAFDVEKGAEAERYLNAPTDQAFVRPAVAETEAVQQPQKQVKGGKAKVELE